jgi:hypothetical membrane protein
MQPGRLVTAARSPRAWLFAMTAVAVAGGALATSSARETDWPALPTLSHLGVDSGSGGILNATLFGLGIVVLAFGISLERTLAGLRSAAVLGRWAERLVTIGFVTAGVAVSLTGLFRVDTQTSTTVHNLAGFASPIVLIATLVGGRLALGNMGRRFDGMSAAILASIVALFTLASQGHALHYPLMELICFGLIGAWLWIFEARLRRLARERR